MLPLRRAAVSDIAKVQLFLKENELPVVGLEQHLQGFVVSEDDDGNLVGVAGLEAHGEAGLLRSVAVAREFRGQGLGHRLIEAVLERGKAIGIEKVYLLTDSAVVYFERLGFKAMERNEVDPAVKNSSEFMNDVCPKATVMGKRL